MIEQLSKFQKTFLEFGKWYFQNPSLNESDIYLIKEECEMESDRELLSLLVEFCDSRGYIITYRWYFDSSESFKGTYECEIYRLPDDHCCLFTTNGVDNRPEATQQAVVKCFELMELHDNT